MGYGQTEEGGENMNGNLLNDVTENKGVLKILKASATLVIIISAGFGWLMTSYGFALTRILPTEALISQKSLSYLLASALHASLVILYITLSISFGRRRIVSSLSLLLPFLCLLTITVYFSFLSIAYEAKGTLTLNKLFSDMKSLDQMITQTDNHIKITFLTKIDALERLARDSDRGFDETSIAACGPICRRHLNSRADLLSRFSLLTQDIPGSNLNTITDVNDLWITVVARYDRFIKKVALFDEFAKEENLPSLSLLKLKDQYAKVQERFGQKDSMDKISVIMNRANRFLKSIFPGEKMDEDIAFFLFLTLAALPEAINFTVMLALAALHKPAQMPIKELEKDIEDEKKIFRLEREYMTTRNLRHLFRRAHNKIFRNNTASEMSENSIGGDNNG